MSLTFQIGFGVGIGLACGLRPFLPVLLACALAEGHHLHLEFRYGHFHFLEKHWWLAAVAGLYVLAWAVQVLLRANPFGWQSPLAIVLGLVGAAAAARPRPRCCSAARCATTATTAGSARSPAPPVRCSPGRRCSRCSAGRASA